MDKDGYHGYDKPVIDESAAKRIATALGWEPKRTWVGLTDEEYKELHLQMGAVYFYQDYGRAIDAKLKEKNT
jgi:hypothetical protein